MHLYLFFQKKYVQNVRTRHAKRSLMLPYKLRTGWKFSVHWNSKACHDRYVICQACFVIHANLFRFFSSKFS